MTESFFVHSSISVSPIPLTTDVKWSRGGYERSALSNVYTGNDMRTMLILKQINRIVTDMSKVTGLGCVSKEHAFYMAEKFNQAGINQWRLLRIVRLKKEEPPTSDLSAVKLRLFSQ